MSSFNELQRRNVLRVAAAYIVASWLIFQVVETLFPLFLSWAFEVTPAGLRLDKAVDREQSAFGQKQWDGLLLNLEASQCARLDCVFVEAKNHSHRKRRSPL